LPVTSVAYGHDNQAKAWKAFEPGAPDFLQTLPEFGALNGYFIYTTGECTIALPSGTLHLYPGWNLIGWS
jgi:hypothetical protein